MARNMNDYTYDNVADHGLEQSYKAAARVPVEKWLTGMLDESRDTHRSVLATIKSSSLDFKGMAQEIENKRNRMHTSIATEGFKETAEKLQKICTVLSSEYEDLISCSATYCFKDIEEAFHNDREAAIRALESGLRAEDVRRQLDRVQKSLRRTDKAVKKLTEDGMYMD